MRPHRKTMIMMVETTHAFVKLKQIKAAVSAGGIKLCFCCFSVPKIDVQIETEQELEKVDVKYFSMAPPAKWVMMY